MVSRIKNIIRKFPLNQCLILMQIHIRILNPLWKKWIRNQIISLWLNEFLTKQNLQILFYFISVNFMLKPDEPFRFFNNSDLGFESKKVCICSFWLIFCPLDPGFRIFLRIRIQEAKISERIKPKVVGSVLVNDFWTTTPINFVHDEISKLVFT